MVASVPIHLPESLLKEADQRARELRIPRAEYIRRAIESENLEVAAKQRRERMIKASRRVREASMRVNAEFDIIEDAPDA
jgi:metal-responsive CopG/Arc/MetJ family transcriptional regulator